MADQPLNLENLKCSPPPTPHSPQTYRAWILKELTIIALLIGDQVTQTRLELTTNELTSTDPRRLYKAFAEVRQKRKFFPKPADIFEILDRETEEDILRPPEARAN